LKVPVSKWIGVSVSEHHPHYPGLYDHFGTDTARLIGAVYRGSLYTGTVLGCLDNGVLFRM
jgi:hypothetical protein